jgi:hypothetical protein
VSLAVPSSVEWSLCHLSIANYAGAERGRRIIAAAAASCAERASEKFSSGERSRGAQEERKGKVT